MPRHVIYIYIYAYIKKSPYDVYTKSPFFLLRRIYAVQIVPWIKTMNTFARPGNGRKLDVPDTVTMAGNQWTSIILPATSIFFLIHWVRCKKLMCPMIFPWISHDIPTQLALLMFPMIFPSNSSNSSPLLVKFPSFAVWRWPYKWALEWKNSYN